MISFPLLLGLCILITGAVLGNCSHTDDFLEFEALSIKRDGTFEIDLTPEQALPLFTAPGEKLWIPSWDPVILKGNGFEEGTVFVTTNHGHTTYWHVLNYDTETKRAQYMRVTPGTDTGTVDISISHNDEGGSIVRVGYQLTGLSEAGNEQLQSAFSETNYAEMMVKWRNMIINNRDKIDVHLNNHAG